MLTCYPPRKFSRVPPSPGFSPAVLRQEDASAHLVLTQGDAVAARCSLWWTGTPRDETGAYGAIGHFDAANASAAGILLEEACRILFAQGCPAILAPMNGNTWRSYRYATGGSLRPPFLLEPEAARGREQYLLAAGFSPVHRYASYLEELRPSPVDPLVPLEQKDFFVRTLEIERLEEELALVYDLAVLAFQENPFYTPLPWNAFVAQYLAYRDFLAPELILLAFHQEALSGFLFCLPDDREGPAPATLLLKTLAVLPTCRGRGLGGGLMALAKHKAAQAGFTHGIGALVYEGNLSRRFCHGDLLREYTLYRRTP